MKSLESYMAKNDDIWLGRSFFENCFSNEGKDHTSPLVVYNIHFNVYENHMFKCIGIWHGPYSYHGAYLLYCMESHAHNMTEKNSWVHLQPLLREDIIISYIWNFI